MIGLQERARSVGYDDFENNGRLLERSRFFGRTLKFRTVKLLAKLIF